HPAAAWAGRTSDAGGAGRTQRIEQPQHHREGRSGAVAGEQLGILLEGPCQLVHVRWPDDGGPDRGDDRLGGQSRVGCGDDLDQHPMWIAAVVVGTLRAAGPALPVPERDMTSLPTGSTGLRPDETGRAVP